MIRIPWIFCCLIVIAAAISAHAAGYFVDAGVGDDADTGISAASPFATIQRAIDAASENPGPDTIQIASGEYVENLTIDDDEKLTLTGGDGVVVTAADAGDDVITVKAGDVTISALKVTNGDNGIKTKGFETSLTLKNVDVSENDNHGLSAKKVGSVTISGGSFSDNGGDGIKVGDEDNETYVKSVTIRGGTFLNNDSDGIDLERIVIVTIMNTMVDGSGDEGLEVDECGSVTVIGGAYTNNRDDGLDLDKSQSVRIVSVLAADNGNGNGDGNGLQIELESGFEMEEAIIINCDFLGNSQNGVQIVEGGGVIHAVTLINITARDNAESGLQVFISGKAKVANITSEYNGVVDILP